MWLVSECRGHPLGTQPTTWVGCGQHIAQVKAGVPAGQRCPGHPKSERAPGPPLTTSPPQLRTHNTHSTRLEAFVSVDSMQPPDVRPRQERGNVRGDTPTMSWRTRSAALALVVLASSGCAGSNSPDDTPAATTPQTAQAPPTAVVEPATVADAIADGAKVIDVRTPEEFAAGHLRGAVNVDLSAPDFDQRIAALDETTDYVVYCASGNRSGTAIETMHDQGFDDLINGGGYEDLAASGLPTA